MYRLESNYGTKSYFLSKDYFDKELLFQSDLLIQKIFESYPNTTSQDKLKILEADISLIEGNYFVAQTKLDAFIQQNSNSPFLPIAYYKKAQIFFKLKRYDHAAVNFSQAKINAQENFESRKDHAYKTIAHKSNYWQAVSAALYGSYNESKEIFEEVIANSSDGEFADDALYALGQTAETLNRYSEAINYYRKIRTDYPFSNNYLRALVRESNNLLSLRKPVLATDLLERTNTAFNHIAINDSLGKKYENQVGMEQIYQEILYLKGEASNIAGNHSEAVTYFVSFLETYNQSNIQNLVRIGLGWAYLNIANYDRALFYYNQILQSEDDSWNTKDLAKLYKAITLKEMGDEQQALDQFSLLAVDSDYRFLGEVLLELGQMYYENNDYESAKRTLERADREAIDVLSTTKIYLLLGATYMELKLWSRAIEYYNKAQDIALKTDVIYLPQKQWYLNELRFKRGVSYLKSGKSNNGIKDLSAYIAEEKDNDRLEIAYFWLAESYYESDLFKNSEQAYNSLLTNYPRSKYKEQALYGLGWSYFNLNKFNESAKIFDELVSNFPNSDYGDEVLARQADAYYKTRNFLNAAKYYKLVEDKYPNSKETEYCAFQLTQALYRGGRVEQSVDALQNFAFKFSDSRLAPNAMFLKGWIRLQQGRYDDAIANFKYLIEAFPNSQFLPNTKYSIGTAYFNAGRYDDAIEAYKKVVESYPKSDFSKKAINNIQEVSFILGKDSSYVEYINDFASKTEDSPFVYDIKKNKANNLVSSGRYQEAINEYENLLGQFPNKEDNAEAIYWIARSYVSMDKPQEAQLAFDKLFAKYPKSSFASEGMLKYAYMYLEMNDNQNADSVFKILMNKYPKSLEAPDAGYQRGRIAMTNQDTNQSIKIFSGVADKYDSTAYGLKSRWIVATVYKRQGKIDSSLAQWQLLAAQELNQSYASEAQYMLGRIYKENNENKEAIKELIVVKEKYSDDPQWYPQSLIDLGELYEAENEWELALEVYNILLEVFPDSEFGKTAKSRIKRVKKMLK
ncbi:tetratricopeptide repeat protein [Candidatus Kapabacteria bacterium]|nr:tetratricopeptide repeat protein [Candidatus Kapabacteria bacterium]